MSPYQILMKIEQNWNRVPHPYRRAVLSQKRTNRFIVDAGTPDERKVHERYYAVGNHAVFGNTWTAAKEFQYQLIDLIRNHEETIQQELKPLGIRSDRSFLKSKLPPSKNVNGPQNLKPGETPEFTPHVFGLRIELLPEYTDLNPTVRRKANRILMRHFDEIHGELAELERRRRNSWISRSNRVPHPYSGQPISGLTRQSVERIGGKWEHVRNYAIGSHHTEELQEEFATRLKKEIKPAATALYADLKKEGLEQAASRYGPLLVFPRMVIRGQVVPEVGKLLPYPQSAYNPTDPHNKIWTYFSITTSLKDADFSRFTPQQKNRIETITRKHFERLDRTMRRLETEINARIPKKEKVENAGLKKI